MDQFPMIRLEVEGMKHSVVHAFANHNREIEEYVDKAVADAIKNFNLDAYVSSETHKAIEAVVDSTLRSYLDWKLRDAIQEAARAEIVKRLNTHD
jgi:L-lactate utilization protein LutC